MNWCGKLETLYLVVLEDGNKYNLPRMAWFVHKSKAEEFIKTQPENKRKFCVIVEVKYGEWNY